MELLLQDRQYILRNEYKQLVEKDNVFSQTKNIISETNSITSDYIALAYMWTLVIRIIDVFDSIFIDNPKLKKNNKTHERLQRLAIKLQNLLELSEKRCTGVWEKVLIKSPDMVQHYFFEEQVKVEKSSITLVLHEIVYHVFESMEKENICEENCLKEFAFNLKKMLKDIYV